MGSWGGVAVLLLATCAPACPAVCVEGCRRRLQGDSYPSVGPVVNGFARVHNGTCESAGMIPIHSFMTCLVAAVSVPDPKLWVSTTGETPVPEGCYDIADSSTAWLSTNPENKGRGSEASLPHRQRRPICQLATETSGGSTVQRSPVLEGRRGLEIVLAAVGVSIVALVAVARRRTIRSRAWQAAMTLRTCCSACLACHGDDVRESQAPLRKALGERRRVISVSIATCFLVIEVAHLITAAVIQWEGCHASGYPHYESAVHLTMLCVAVLYLLCHRWRNDNMLPINLFWVASVTFTFVTATVEKEHVLLNPNRLYLEVVRRLAMGICTTPLVALIGNVALSGAMYLLYVHSFPEDVVIAPQRGFGTYAWQGCVEALPADRGAMARLDELRGAMARLDQLEVVWFRELVGPLQDGMDTFLEWLVQRRTSSDFLMQEMVILASVTTFLFVLHMVMAEELTQKLRATSSEDMREAMSHILDRLCDCVVHLDSECKVSQPAPRLSALLHRHAGSHALKGTSFSDLCVEGGPETWHENSDSPEQGFRESLRVSLRDAFGMPVPCWALITEYYDLQGRQSYLVGLNEHGERERNLARGSNPIVIDIEAGEGGSGDRVAPLAEEDSERSSRRRQRSGSRRSKRRRRKVQEQPMLLEAEASTFTLVRHCAEFTEFFGPRPSGMSLWSLLDEDTCTDLQESITAFIETRETCTRAEVYEFGRMVLQLPSGEDDEGRYPWAEVEADIAFPAGEATGDYRFEIRITQARKLSQRPQAMPAAKPSATVMGAVTQL